LLPDGQKANERIAPRKSKPQTFATLFTDQKITETKFKPNRLRVNDIVCICRARKDGKRNGRMISMHHFPFSSEPPGASRDSLER
jgi:hypothetical protein